MNATNPALVFSISPAAIVELLAMSPIVCSECGEQLATFDCPSCFWRIEFAYTWLRIGEEHVYCSRAGALVVSPPPRELLKAQWRELEAHS